MLLKVRISGRPRFAIIASTSLTVPLANRMSPCARRSRSALIAAAAQSSRPEIEREDASWLSRLSRVVVSSAIRASNVRICCCAPFRESSRLTKVTAKNRSLLVPLSSRGSSTVQVDRVHERLSRAIAWLLRKPALVSCARSLPRLVEYRQPSTTHLSRKRRLPPSPHSSGSDVRGSTTL